MSSAAPTISNLAHVSPHRRLPVADYWGRWFVLVTVFVWASSVVIGFGVALAALTLFSMALTAIGLFQPRIGLLGLGMALTLDAVTRLHLASGGLFRFNTLNYWLILTALCSLMLLLSRDDAHTHLLVGLTLVLSLGLVVSEAPSLGGQHLLGLLAVFGIIVYFARCSSDPRIWLWMGILNGTLSGVGGLALYALKATRGDHNVWANFPLTGLFSICLAVLFARERGQGRMLLNVLAMVNCAWVFLSGSRGALTLAIICMVFLCLSMRGIRHRLLFAGAGGLALLAAFICFPELAKATIERVNKVFDPTYTAAESTSGRSVLAAGGLEVFQKNPLGIGTGGYAIETAVLASQTFSRGQIMQAHSGWIKTLAENGVLGAAMLGAYVVSFAAVGYRRGGSALSLGVFTSVILAVALVWTEFANKGMWLLASATTVLINPGRRCY